MLDFKTAKMP